MNPADSFENRRKSDIFVGDFPIPASVFLRPGRHHESTSHPLCGWLEFSSCDNCRWQEKTEARLGFDVELAVAPGLGKNHTASNIGQPFSWNVSAGKLRLHLGTTNRNRSLF
jgi:hypothetical protein